MTILLLRSGVSPIRNNGPSQLKAPRPTPLQMLPPMSYKSTLVLVAVNIWRSHTLVVPRRPTFSKHVILSKVVVLRHIHPAHVLLPVVGGTIMKWVVDCVVPLLRREWELPGLVQELHNRRVKTWMIHRFETEIIHQETIFVSGSALCQNLTTGNSSNPFQ